MPTVAPSWKEYAGELEKQEKVLNGEYKDLFKGKKLWKGPLIPYLAAEGLKHLEEMDYELRKRYVGWLQQSVKKEYIEVYLKAYDAVKQASIQKQRETLPGERKVEWKYKNEILFIPYHPDPQVVKNFASVRTSPNMAWDFKRHCGEHLKRQVFTVLNYIIENYGPGRQREYKLTGLQLFYDFCEEQRIQDIELMEAGQAEQFKAYLMNHISNEQTRKRMYPILSIARKNLFLEAREVHWHANVWYLKRFHFVKDRLNYSDEIERISFLDVAPGENRELLKEFMRYELGITERAVSTIYDKYRKILKFLQAMEKDNLSALECDAKEMDCYIKELQELPISAKVFNEYLSSIAYFYRFLVIRRYLPKIPFEIGYYLKKQIPVHHDRSVEEATCMEIIKNLASFPEDLRLMFLHLWCVGLRISEVCTLKGNAYFMQNDDYWMQVYQIKTDTYKRVPIPETLYKLMQVYLKKYGRTKDAYIFQNRKGNAFSYGTFIYQMKKYCQECGIQGGEYLFKSHDYRHTVATTFYEHGVSVQSIRDYLGHNWQEMTMQYIDYMPKRIAEHNDAYFKEEGNSLLACMEEGI